MNDGPAGDGMNLPILNIIAILVSIWCLSGQIPRREWRWAAVTGTLLALNVLVVGYRVWEAWR